MGKVPWLSDPTLCELDLALARLTQPSPPCVPAYTRRHDLPPIGQLAVSSAGMDDIDSERITELEIKLVYQEQLIRELDALVRTFGTKLDETLREMKTLREGVKSPQGAMGPGNDPPPHY